MPLPVAVSVVSVAGFAIIFVILVQPLIFSDVHVAGSKGADVNAVFPEIFTLVTLVPTSAKAVSPVGKVGSVVSDGQPDKFKVKVLDGNPAILVSPAPEIGNPWGKAEHPARLSDVHVAGSIGILLKFLHPARFSVVSAAGRVGKDNNAEQFVRFSVVHVAGIVGNDVNPVSPVRLTVVSLVLFRFKVVSPVGKVGSVVSDGQPDKFKLKVLDGNPSILVSPAPAIVNAVGKLVHPDRFSNVHVAGRMDNELS